MQLRICKGRPPKVTDFAVIEEIRKNPNNLSNKELCKKYNIAIPTLIKIRYSRGVYANVTH